MRKSELNHSVIAMVPLKICLLNTITEKPEAAVGDACKQLVTNASR